jgi:hypothetical protein
MEEDLTKCPIRSTFLSALIPIDKNVCNASASSSCTNQITHIINENSTSQQNDLLIIAIRT